MAMVTLVAGAVTMAPAAQAGFRDHQGLAPQAPATGYPVILGSPLIPLPGGTNQHREVFATTQAGRYIVAGGNFQNILLQNGTTLAKSFFATWNVDTKQLACPTMTFDNEVLAVAEGPTANTVYVGGRFASVTGADGVAPHAASWP